MITFKFTAKWLGRFSLLLVFLALLFFVGGNQFVFASTVTFSSNQETYVFDTPGNHEFVIPSGQTPNLKVQVWGAGGPGGVGLCQYPSLRGGGGGGGYSEVEYQSQGSHNIEIIVGAGGAPSSFNGDPNMVIQPGQDSYVVGKSGSKTIFEVRAFGGGGGAMFSVLAGTGKGGGGTNMFWGKDSSGNLYSPLTSISHKGGNGGNLSGVFVAGGSGGGGGGGAGSMGDGKNGKDGGGQPSVGGDGGFSDGGNGGQGGYGVGQTMIGYMRGRSGEVPSGGGGGGLGCISSAPGGGGGNGKVIIVDITPTVTTTATPFDYSLSKPNNVTITAGQSGSAVVKTTLVSGSAKAVTLTPAVQGPVGAVNPPNITPVSSAVTPTSGGVDTTFSFTTETDTTLGDYTVTVTGSSGASLVSPTITSASADYWVRTLFGGIGGGGGGTGAGGQLWFGCSAGISWLPVLKAVNYGTLRAVGDLASITNFANTAFEQAGSDLLGPGTILQGPNNFYENRFITTMSIPYQSYSYIVRATDTSLEDAFIFDDKGNFVGLGPINYSPPSSNYVYSEVGPTTLSDPHGSNPINCRTTLKPTPPGLTEFFNTVNQPPVPVHSTTFTITVVAPQTPPDTPSLVAGTPFCGSTAINLVWTNVTNEDGYRLYYTTVAGSSSFTEIDGNPSAPGIQPFPRDATSYNHTGLSLDTNYYYKLTAFNAAGVSFGGFDNDKTTTCLPDLTANAPALSDQYGNNTNTADAEKVLGAGTITINGTINNSGNAATANGAFGNRFDFRLSGSESWKLLHTVSLADTFSVLSAGATNRAVKEYTWTEGVGTWDFRLTADTNNMVVEESEENNTSAPTTVEIVDYTPTLAANPTTALAGDTITFTASAVRQGKLTNPASVAFSNPSCGDGGTASAIASVDATTARFSCSYSTPGTKTATVSASYYKIPKTASAEVTVLTELQTSTPSCTEGQGKINAWLKKKATGAVSYALHRDTVEIFTPNDTNKIADFTSANVPTTQAGAFVDAGLALKSAYYYKIVALGSGGVAGSVSVAATDDASLRCPDLVVESVALPNSPGLPAGTVLSETGGHSFSAVIKNVGEGTDSTKTFFNQISVNGVEVDNFPKNQPISNGLAEGLTKTITSGSWLAPPVTKQETRTMKVCADQPPPEPGNISEAPPTGIPVTGPNPAEINCLETQITIAPPPLTVQLECENQGGVYKNDYCVIDYSQTSKLRWTIGGVPSSCKWVQSDIRGDAANKSYTVAGNPFSLTNLLNKLSFKYQLDCSR